MSDTFQAQSAVSNGAYDEGKLSLPSPCIVLDLYQAGINETNTGFSEKELTAQVAWPFVASAFDVAGTVFAFWFIIDNCFELKKLLSMLRKLKGISRQYYRNNFKKMDLVIADLSHERKRSVAHIDLLQENEKYIHLSTQSRNLLNSIKTKELQNNEFTRNAVNSSIAEESTLETAIFSVLKSSESDNNKK